MKQYRSEAMIDPGAVLHLFRAECAGEQECHCHDFMELVYILSGEAEQFVGKDQYEVRRGDLLLIREGENHAFLSKSSFSYVNICFDPGRLMRDGEESAGATALFGRLAFQDILERNGGRLVHFSEAERTQIVALLGVMEREYAARRFGWREMLRHHIDLLFLSVLRSLEERGVLLGESDPWVALPEYIEAHLTADLSLGALSRRLFYNPSYFSRAFSHRFGTSLSDYVAARRAALAARITEDSAGTMTVEAIRKEAGFTSKSALYRSFLKHRGEPFGSFLDRCKKTNS